MQSLQHDRNVQTNPIPKSKVFAGRLYPFLRQEDDFISCVLHRANVLRSLSSVISNLSMEGRCPFVMHTLTIVSTDLENKKKNILILLSYVVW